AGAALEVAPQLGASEAEIAALELRLGRAQELGGDVTAGLVTLRHAATRAEACGAIETWGEAVIRLARESSSASDLATAPDAGLRELEHLTSVADDRAPTVRALAHALIAELAFSRRDVDTGRTHLPMARELAATLVDPDVQVRVAFTEGMQHLAA